MGDDEQRNGEPYPARFRDSETLVFDMKSTGGPDEAPSFYFLEQTDNVDGVEVDTNTALPESTSAQTEDEGTQGVKPAAEPDASNSDWRHFLDTAVPLMESALDEKVENRVFDDYIYVAQVGLAGWVVRVVVVRVVEEGVAAIAVVVDAEMIARWVAGTRGARRKCMPWCGCCTPFAIAAWRFAPFVGAVDVEGWMDRWKEGGREGGMDGLRD